MQKLKEVSTVRKGKRKRKNDLTNFENTAIIAELLSDDYEMIGEAMPLTTNAVKLNKHSMKDLDKVLDQIKLTSEEMTKLKQIIEATK